MNTIIKTLKNDLSNRITQITIIILLVSIIFSFTVTSLDPMTRLFGIPCPGCGGTRAFYSLLKFDIARVFYYNASVFFLVIVLLMIPLRNLAIFKRRVTLNRLLICYILISLSIYIYGLIFRWGDEVYHWHSDALIFSFFK